MTGKEAPCRDCEYKAKLGNGPAADMTCYCNYIGVTGRARPCPPGKGCTAAKGLGRKKRRPDQKNAWPHETERRFYDT